MDDDIATAIRTELTTIRTELAQIRNQSNATVSSLQRNNAYLARQEIERVLAITKVDEKRLEQYGFKVYSQGDEDGIIEEICRRLGLNKGTFCEIGVENGLECNSLYLIHKGWTGVWIEGDSARKEQLAAKFHSIIPSRLRLAIGIITAENINLTFSKIPVPSDLDFLSIDIDGMDIYLLDALDIRPKIICIEYNAKFPANISKKPVYNSTKFWAGTDYMGSSLKAMCETAEGKGYRLVATSITGGNAFFVRDDLCGDYFTKNSSPEYLYNPPRYWLVFDHFWHIGHRADFGPYVDLISESS
jgi:hypothetical protein